MSTHFKTSTDEEDAQVSKENTLSVTTKHNFSLFCQNTL